MFDSLLVLHLQIKYIGTEYLPVNIELHFDGNNGPTIASKEGQDKLKYLQWYHISFNETC